MKLLQQALRRPLKLIAGVLLIALAVSALCVCMGQRVAAQTTQRQLDEIYLTAAFPANLYRSGDGVAWLREYAQAHPEVVKEWTSVSTISAYAPDVQAELWSEYLYETLYISPSLGAPYNAALLEITLVAVGQVKPVTYSGYNSNGVLYKLEDPSGAVNVELVGVVERPVGLHSAQADPSGYRIIMDLKLESREDLEKLELQIGQRYLVYGMDYMDLDVQLRNRLTQYNPSHIGVDIPCWDLQQTTVEYVYTEKEVDEKSGLTTYYYIDTTDPQNPERKATTYVQALERKKIRAKLEDAVQNLEYIDLDNFQTITMSLVNYGVFPAVEIHQDPDGNMTVSKPQEVQVQNENGETVCITLEEYAQRYRIPTIVKLEDSVENYLAGEAGALWNQMLQDMQINNHAFLMVGVQQMHHLENLHSGKLWIDQGRDFSRQERETGAKVCLISQTVAKAAGLAVGDTIDLSAYQADRSAAFQSSSQYGYGPAPYRFYSSTTELGEMDSYTIVGIYDLLNPFYAQGDQFNANTIFVPDTVLEKKPTLSGTSYETIILQNGALETFLLAAVEAGFADLFTYTDGGYAAVADSLEHYKENADVAQKIGIGIFGMILLLYLMFFIGRQKKVLLVMEAVGAGRCRMLMYMLGLNMIYLIPGMLLGAVSGMLLWDSVVSRLTNASAFALDIAIPISAFAEISVIQFGVSLGVAMLIACMITGRQSMRT